MIVVRFSLVVASVLTLAAPLASSVSTSPVSGSAPTSIAAGQARLVDQAYADQDHPLLNTIGDSRPARPGSLGLKMDRTRGPAEYLVVDSAQKPRPNTPFAELYVGPPYEFE